MARLNLYACVVFALLINCNGEGQKLSDQPYRCKTIPVYQEFSRVQLLHSFDRELLQGLAAAHVPNEEGAMGRNKSAYFHVRFQMGILALSDAAVACEDIQVLEHAIRAIEYSFKQQKADGNYNLIIPADLSYQTPQQADLASGVAFFLSALGPALLNFDQSDWYRVTIHSNYRNRIEALRPKIALAAQWLYAQKGVLEVADQHALNRLFFNALAFYSLGIWLQDEKLKDAGIAFVEMAISKIDSSGYFLEGKGWDSSYQGVALNIGFNLYSILPSGLKLKDRLWDCLSCASDWQISRILETGEISTQGNERVYEGGERFLGKEKQVDWMKSMLALYSMGYYSKQSSYLLTARKVREFYQ